MNFLKAALAALALLAVPACLVREVEEVPPNAEIVETAPPPAQVEVIPLAPGPANIWVGGHWVWRRGWIWAPGRYELRREGYAWRHGHWARYRHGWVWIEGRWGR